MISPTSYEAYVFDAVITMLAASATFRTLVGAVDSAGARKFIVESDGGTDLDNLAVENRRTGKLRITACDDSTFQVKTPLDQAFAKIHSDEPDQPYELAVGYFGHKGTMMIGVVVPFTASDSAPSRLRREKNRMGAIKTEMEAQIGSANCLQRCTITAKGPAIGGDTGVWRESMTFGFSIEWGSP